MIPVEEEKMVERDATREPERITREKRSEGGGHLRRLHEPGERS